MSNSDIAPTTVISSEGDSQVSSADTEKAKEQYERRSFLANICK